MNTAEGKTINGYEIRKISDRGAALLAINGRQSWILPKSFENFQNTGKITKKIKDIATAGESIAEAAAARKEADDFDKSFYNVRATISEETEKAYKLSMNGGRKAWVPKSLTSAPNGSDTHLDPEHIGVARWFYFQKIM